MSDENDWLERDGFSMPGMDDGLESEKPSKPSGRSAKKRKSHRSAGETYDSMRRSLVMVACIAIAIAVGAMLYSSYRTMQAEEMVTQVQEMAESERASQQAVLVTTREIAPGEIIGEADIAEAAVPSAYVPVDVVTPDGAGTLVGKRSIVRLSQGVPVFASAVQASHAPATLASAVSDGYVALSLSLDEASGVSPLLRVGDKVDLISQSNSVWSTLLSDVRVLALDAEFGSAQTEGYSRVTLELAPGDAVLVSAAEQVRLALRPAEIVEEA